MGWKIITDKTFKPENEKLYENNGPRCIHCQTDFGNKSYVGRERDYKGLDAITLRVGDDDGNHYYTARCDDDSSAEAFHDWAAYDSGCTWSTYYDKESKKWKGYIS
jgi:hypothetical protein